MPEKKAAKKSALTTSVKAKVGKTVKTTMASTTQRAAAVEKNLGESQSLRDFLNGVGWR